jgi:hypothetical protein
MVAELSRSKTERMTDKTEARLAKKRKKRRITGA